MQLRLRNLINQHPALSPSVVGAVTFVLSLLFFGAGIGPIPLVEVGGGAIIFFATVFSALRLGGRRGLVVLWVLLPMLWINALYGALENAGWIFTRAARAVPEPFVAWSMLALPLCAATTVFLNARHMNPYRQRLVFVGIAAWLVLLTFSSHLSRYAPDVGPSPRDYPIAEWISVALFLVPFIVSWTSVRQTMRVDHDARAVNAST